MKGAASPDDDGVGGLPPAVNAHDRWAISATVVSHSAGLAVVECVACNQALGTLPPYRLTLEWKPGMEQRDVEARALAVAAKSLAYLRQAMVEEAAAKVS